MPKDPDADSDTELVQCSENYSIPKTQGLQGVETDRGQNQESRLLQANKQTK